jgi:cation diffusion facilitator CzcD-associated flavoprotein CzcO
MGSHLEHMAAVVIGAGQAGLSTSHELAARVRASV